jgi:hypothetical protein
MVPRRTGERQRWSFEAKIKQYFHPVDSQGFMKLMKAKISKGKSPEEIHPIVKRKKTNAKLAQAKGLKPKRSYMDSARPEI